MKPEHQASNQALVYLLQKIVPRIATPNPDFPPELHELKPELEKSLCTFIKEWDARCRKSKSQSGPTQYECPYCTSSSGRYDDWKKHQLIHETNHEQRWQWPGDRRSFERECDFHKHHKTKCSECRDWKKEMCHGMAKRKKKQPCSCVRCLHAEQARASMEVRHACGFCITNEVFDSWEKYCGHLRDHFKEGIQISAWSYSRVISALICRHKTLSERFHNIAGSDLLSWVQNTETEKLRQDLQSYDVDSDFDVEEAYRLARRLDNIGDLPEPRNPQTSMLEGGYEPASRHSAGQLSGSIPSANTHEAMDLLDPFMGGPDEMAQAIDTLDPSTTTPHIRDNLLASNRANLPSGSIPTTPVAINTEDCGEPPSQEDLNLNPFASDLHAKLWFEIICSTPGQLDELCSYIGPDQLLSMMTDYRTACESPADHDPMSV